MPRVTLRGYITVPESELSAVIDELDNHITLTRAEAGCLVFEVSQDQHNPLRFNVYEEFASTEAFEHHQRRVRASIWARVTRNVERHYTIEELES